MYTRVKHRLHYLTAVETTEGVGRHENTKSSAVDLSSVASYCVRRTPLECSISAEMTWEQMFIPVAQSQLLWA